MDERGRSTGEWQAARPLACHVDAGGVAGLALCGVRGALVGLVLSLVVSVVVSLVGCATAPARSADVAERERLLLAMRAQNATYTKQIEELQNRIFILEGRLETSRPPLPPAPACPVTLSPAEPADSGPASLEPANTAVASEPSATLRARRASTSRKTRGARGDVVRARVLEEAHDAETVPPPAGPSLSVETPVEYVGQAVDDGASVDRGADGPRGSRASGRPKLVAVGQGPGSVTLPATTTSPAGSASSAPAIKPRGPSAEGVHGPGARPDAGPSVPMPTPASKALPVADPHAGPGGLSVAPGALPASSSGVSEELSAWEAHA